MKRSTIRLILPAIALSFSVLACTVLERMPLLEPTRTPTLTSTPSPLPPTPTETPTPTLPPTPTPLPAARIESGDQARFFGDWERALNEYQVALQSSNEAEVQSAALLGLGRTQYQAGNYEAAVETLQQLLGLFPQSAHVPYAHFTIAQTYSSLGRYSEAADSYLNYMVLKPGVVDAYLLEQRGDALQAVNRQGEALIDYRAALQAPGFLDGTTLEIKIARSHAAVGDYATALGIYQDIYNRTDSDFTRAQLDLLIGQAYIAQGQFDQAYAVFQDAVNNYPRSYDSYSALLTLVEAGVPVDELNRGLVDYFAGQYGVAIAAFDRYFQANGADPATARYYNGLSLRALGGRQDALAEWDKVILNFPDHRLWDESWEQKAYTQWAFMEDYTRAIETLLGFVSAAPAHARAGEFLFDAGVVSEIAGELQQAAEIWERVGREYPGYEQAPRAIFLAGVARYRIQDYANAYNLFQLGLENATTMPERTAAYLWMGKCRQAQGDAPSAAAAWELAANLDPTGYYSERARDILQGRAPFSPPQQYDLSMDLSSERAEAEAWMRTVFNLTPDVTLSDPGSLVSDPRFQRGSELWELGLYDAARAEFEDLRLAIQDDPAANFRLANYLLELGSYRQAILAARQVLNLAGMSDADTLNAPAYFNHIRFGTYFSDLILPAAIQHNFHPLFLFSVVRQESAFESFVRSSAGARGLMQIVPATGQEIANSLNWPPNYTAEDLYRPLVSVNLGSEYLAKWLKQFNSDPESSPDLSLYAALAAYNGGPGNAIAWQKQAQGDIDIFLEVVRFEETRNYIRGIYEIFNIYRRIYDRTP